MLSSSLKALLIIDSHILSYLRYSDACSLSECETGDYERGALQDEGKEYMFVDPDQPVRRRPSRKKDHDTSKWEKYS